MEASRLGSPPFVPVKRLPSQSEEARHIISDVSPWRRVSNIQSADSIHQRPHDDKRLLVIWDFERTALPNHLPTNLAYQELTPSQIG